MRRAEVEPEVTEMIYKLVWEMVKMGELRQFCDADPVFYDNVKQIVPNSKIPDAFWFPIEKVTSNPWNQYRTLRQWDQENREFVRNVKLYQAVRVEPDWQEVND